MILALAGRRVDAADASEERFPLRNVAQVSKAVAALLTQQSTTAVVSSAACGADLIALSEAGKLGLRRRVVLPVGRVEFRDGSVTDRPGDWGGLYDMITNDVASMGDLVVMGDLGDADLYIAANHLILDEATALGSERRDTVAAVVIWEGAPRGEQDYTAEFGAEARRRGLAVFEILTR